MLRPTCLNILLGSVLFFGACANGSKLTSKGKTPGMITFVASSEKYEAHGSFGKWHFTKLNIPNEGLTGMTATLEIDMSSVREGDQKLVKELRTENYFDSNNFPVATVRIEGVEKGESEHYKAILYLEIKGKKHDLVTEFELLAENPYHIKGEVTIVREDYSIALGLPNIKSKVRVLYNTILKK